MSRWLVAMCALLGACDSDPAPPSPSDNLVFVGHVFDGTEAFEGAVEVDDTGVIVAVHRTVPPGIEGTRVDIGEGTLLPGMIDLHTHITAAGGNVRTVPVDDHEPNLKALLRAGVTSFLHLGGMARVSFEIRRREREGELLSPRMFSVGPFLDPPGSSHCAAGIQQLDHCVALSSPAAAEQAVANLERIYGPDALKITHDSGFAARPSNAFDDATLRALVGAAGETPIVAHIRNVADIDSAVAAGVGTVTHMPFFERFTAEQASVWVAAGTRFMPTIGLHPHEIELLTGTFDLDDPTLVHDAPQAVLDEIRAFRDMDHDPAAVDLVVSVRENAEANFGVLLEADAIILAGSDAGIFGLIHGRSLVQELEEMVAYGMSDTRALRAATSVAADFLNRADLGRIAVGAVADLVIVDGNPLEDISALHSVRAVYLGGEQLSREELEVDRGISLESDPARIAPPDAHCLRTSECSDGDTCTRLYMCARRCDDSSDCDAGSFCAIDIADGRGCYPSLDCDLLVQNCNNTTACVPMANGATWCASAGSARAGESCDGMSLSTLCAPGTRCNGGTCEQLCELGAATCPAGQTCTTLETETGVSIGACR